MDKTPLTPGDIAFLVIHGDPQIAPGGDVYYVRSAYDPASEKTVSRIWRARGTLAPSPFTGGEKDSLPRLSPDGRYLAFASNRGDGARVYLMPTDGGESHAISPCYPGVFSIAWSADGQRLAFTATAEHEPAIAHVFLDEKSGARHVRALPFKSDADGLLDGRRRHLFLVDRDGAGLRQVTRGGYDVGAPAWSPDGRAIVFASLKDRPETAFATGRRRVDLESGNVEQLTHGGGPSFAPSFSPDGSQIAFAGHRKGEEGGGGRYNVELFVMPSCGGAARSLSAALDRPVGDWLAGDARSGAGQQPPIWSPDGRELFVAVGSEGATRITAFGLDGTMRAITTAERQLPGFARNAAGVFAFVSGDALEPSCIVLRATDGSERTVTADNAWLGARTIRAPRRLRPRAVDGTELDVWILDPDRPANAPLVLEIHGGPHGAYGAAFFFEFQILAAHGIGVAYGNPRGSQTYGESYANCITGRWGEVDAADVLTLLDAAEAAGTWDRERIGVAGGSYGGFMTSWLLGHSKRFAAGVSMRAVNEFTTQFAVSDINSWIGEELGAPWNDGGRGLFERSPMRAAHEIDVPLLIDHSERDYRCPIDQGEQLFALLRILGRKNVEFVRFTGDGHELSRSGNTRSRILRLRAIAHWFIRHLRPEGIAAAPQAAGSLFDPLPGEDDAR
jgi:dipeptidyl aminopeptidase/acylaminoacyl peptidase